MAELITVHPQDPQRRQLRRAVEILRTGGLIVYPTDSCYALGCQIANRAARERIRQIRHAERHHLFTLACRDLSEIAVYARVDNRAYRMLRSLTPGPYTFILKVTGEVPKRLRSRRRTIGIRVPDHAVALALLEELDEPMMSSSLLLPGMDWPLTDPELIDEQIGHAVDAVVAAGPCGTEPTTVIDLTGTAPEVIRAGKGEVSPLVE